MGMNLDQYEGKKFCVVFVKVNEEEDTEKPVNYQVRCLHGQANIEQSRILHLEHEGGRFTVPASCYTRIMPNDGTKMLRDAEFFVMCKVEGMEL